MRAEGGSCERAVVDCACDRGGAAAEAGSECGAIERAGVLLPSCDEGASRTGMAVGLHTMFSKGELIGASFLGSSNVSPHLLFLLPL